MHIPEPILTTAPGRTPLHVPWAKGAAIGTLRGAQSSAAKSRGPCSGAARPREHGSGLEALNSGHNQAEGTVVEEVEVVRPAGYLLPRH